MNLGTNVPHNNTLSAGPHALTSGVGVDGAPLAQVTFSHDRTQPGVGKSASRNVPAEAYKEVISKLFLSREDGKERLLYRAELEAVANKKGWTAEKFVEMGLEALERGKSRILLDECGRIRNPGSLGAKFEALYKIINKNVDIYVIKDEAQLSCAKLPFSQSYRDEFKKVIEKGEAVMALYVKTPPKEAVDEIEAITKNELGGVMSFWTDKNYRDRIPSSQKLKDWMKFASVRILCTGNNPEATQVVKGANEKIEESFEDQHLVKAIRQISDNQQRKALWTAAAIVLPIMAAVPGIEAGGNWLAKATGIKWFGDGLTHAMGGALDDGASVAANAMQSMFGLGTLMDRIKRGLPAIKHGLAGIPIAMGLCAASSWLFDTGNHALQLAAGVMFALGCSLGTLGASFGEFKHTLKNINDLEKNPQVGELIAKMTPGQRAWYAFKDCILNVPFRLGHSVIGVSAQILLGIAAVEMGFFKNHNFVTWEGVLESITGVAAALAIPWISKKVHFSKMKKCEV